MDISSVYEGVAGAWAAGPSHLYRRLARELIDAYPAPLEGRAILDLGAGTGVVSRLLIEHGARPFAVDSARDMIEHAGASGIPGVVGDLLSLPLDDASFDGAIAAFSISHVSDPGRALAEAKRVVRDRGAVVAGVFAARPSNPSKEVINAIAEKFGFVAPDWYLRWKQGIEPMTNTPDVLHACAEDAGLAEIVVTERVVETGIETPEDIVTSRLGMAYLAPFVASLSSPARSRFIAEATEAVARDPQPLRPAVLIMSGRVRRGDPGRATS